MDFSYYGRMEPISIESMKAKGVHLFMVDEYIQKKIDTIEEKLTKMFQEYFDNFRKDVLSKNKKIKEIVDALVDDKTKREKKEKEEDRKKVDCHRWNAS